MTAQEATLTTTDCVLLIIGVVIGTGIFALPSAVAANAGSGSSFMLLWLTGGVVSFVGAMCYAELASAYPDSGGDYHYLRRAFGANVGFLFAWARLAVMQPGSLAIQAYIVGEYIGYLVPAFPATSYAFATVALITWINLLGVHPGRLVQGALSVLTFACLILVMGVGLFAVPDAAPIASEIAKPGFSFGYALIFVLLTYGGWNEVVFVSAELRDTQKSIVRSLIIGIAVITVAYLGVNFAYLRALGIKGMAESDAVAAEVLARSGFPGLALFTSVSIVLAALSTMNATTITGARSSFALGRDTPLLRGLGRWNTARRTPSAALWVQGFVTIALVLLGAVTRQKLDALVDYTAPVFWLFFSLVTVALIVLRRRDPHRSRPFQVPLYPVFPLLFCSVCLYMLHASLVHTGAGALVGIAVLAAGVPLMLVKDAKYSRNSRKEMNHVSTANSRHSRNTPR